MQKMMNKERFLSEIDLAVDEHAMLKHPFYKSWSAGALSKETLTQYAKQYYAHVSAFPTYVSGVHSQCDELPVRQALLENLIEEERGAENHPQLWMRFAESLGAVADEVRSAPLLDATKESVESLRVLTRERGYLQGLAALYAYESQIPEVAKTKREGLKSFYSIDDKDAVSFFSVHEDADLIHRDVERKLLADGAKTRSQQDSVIAAARDGAKALWRFLDGVQEAYLKPAAAC